MNIKKIINKYNLLTESEEKELLNQTKLKIREAEEELICRNLRFILKIARKYRNFNLTIDELVSEGNLGLLEAVRRYDESKGKRFIDYAAFWIEKTIVKAIDKRVKESKIFSSTRLEESDKSENIFNRDLLDKINKFILTLPELERDVFIKRYYEDRIKSYRELAIIFNTTHHKIRRITEKVRIKIKKYIEE